MDKIGYKPDKSRHIRKPHPGCIFALGTLILPSIIHEKGEWSAMKIAIVGCGGLGTVHADCYSAIPGVAVTGVCDLDADAARKLAERTGARAFASFEEMLAQTECDAVSVTLPSHLHKTFAVKAAMAGKHVICEKPIALNLEDAAEMIRVCREQGVRLFVGHVVRFFPEYVQMKRKVEEGAIGRPGVAHAKRFGSHPGLKRPWFKDDACSGGAVVDLMVHDIDFMRWTLGEVQTVYGLRAREGDVDYNSATLLFESGAVANLEAYWGYAGPFTTYAEIAGSKGIIVSDGTRSRSLQIRKSSPGEAGGPFVEVPQSPGYRSPFLNELAHFIDCIRSGEEPIVTAHDAYKALEIALAITESARTGQAVMLQAGAGEGSR